VLATEETLPYWIKCTFTLDFFYILLYLYTCSKIFNNI